MKYANEVKINLIMYIAEKTTYIICKNNISDTYYGL